MGGGKYGGWCGGGGVWSGGKHVTWDMLTCTAKMAANRNAWLHLHRLSRFLVNSLFFFFSGSSQTITWQSVISLLVNIMPFSVLQEMRELKHNLVKESTCFSCILVMYGSGNLFSSIEYSFVFSGGTGRELSC